MLRSVVRNRWLRWITYIFIGILVKFILDITFSLMFRNYTLLQPLTDYLYVILLTAISLESIHLLRSVIKKRYSWDKNPFKRFYIQWAFSLFAILVIVFALRWLGLLIFKSFYFVRLLDEVIILIMALLVITSMILFELGMYLLDKWRFQLAELERFKKESIEFQFESLRSQINPHFLFNSLNTLSSLVYENQEKAEAFIRELADVYRYILENRGKELVSLKEELDVARSYIYLIQLRFDKNLIIDLNIPESLSHMKIAPLTLQLLLENTVKHNVISRKRPLNVDIFTDHNYLVVKNNLQKKSSPEQSSQMGLKNIQSRYAFLTNKKMIVEESDLFYTVKIPLI